MKLDQLVEYDTRNTFLEKNTFLNLYTICREVAKVAHFGATWCSLSSNSKNKKNRSEKTSYIFPKMAFLIPRETELSYISGSTFQSLKSK